MPDTERDEFNTEGERWNGLVHPDKDLFHGAQAGQIEEIFRPGLQKTLNSPEAKGEPAFLSASAANDEGRESKEGIDFKSGYAECLQDLKSGHFLDDQRGVREGDASLPTLEEVRAAFSDELIEAAKRYKNPEFYLVPGTSYSSKLQGLDRVLKPGQKSPLVIVNDKKYPRNSALTPEKIAGWSVVIAEAAPETEEGGEDNTKDPLHIRIRNRRSINKKTPGKRGIDHHLHAMMMLRAIRKGRPIDSQTTTLFDEGAPDLYNPNSMPLEEKKEDDLNRRHIARGWWDKGQQQYVVFFSYQPGRDEDARLREAIVGNLKAKNIK